MRKLPTRKLLAAVIAGALFVPATGFALGLGEIEVNSALNQRLNADIELLSADPEETEKIIVKLASRKEFSRAGLDRPYLLSDLRFKSTVVDGVTQINVSSGSPIREPFINFLIEVDWPKGHLLREYTILLDPPVFMTQSASTAPVQSSGSSEFRPAANAPATTAKTPVSAQISPRPIVQSAPIIKDQMPVAPQAATGTQSTAPTFIPAPVVQSQTPTKQITTRYRVKSGDTAWKLADAMRPNQSVTVPQMLMALLRTNPESFINGNVNGLKRGYILRAPDAAQIASISHKEAQAMLREHSALWRQYQQAKAGKSSGSARPAVTEKGTNTPANAAVANDNAHLAIVTGGGTSTSAGKNPVDMSAQELRAELALAKERVETERVEKEALKQRVDSLEQSAVKMKGMLTIEDKELAGVQSLNLPAEKDSVDAKEAAIAETDTTEADMSAEGMPAGGKVENLAEQTEESSDQVSTEKAIFTDELASEGEANIKLKQEAAVLAADTEPNMFDEVPEADKDPLTQLLNNPTLLAVAGGGLLLIAALLALIVKRRRDGATVAPAPMMGNANDLESLADDIAEQAEMDEVGEDLSEEVSDVLTADEDLDDAEDVQLQDVPAQEEPVAEIEEESRDDVIAEADVYLAYGIYQQAEDLLDKAILEHPENDSYRVKLAETHFTSKNSDAFIETATEIKQRVGDDSAAWKKVMLMGQELCADEPMFQGEVAAEPEISATSSDELPMDFDTESVDAGDAVNADVDSDPLELPDLDIETEDELPGESVEPVDEIEFDLSDTGAFEEESVTEDEFSLDIDASELDIEAEVVTENTEDEGFDLGDIDMSVDEKDVAESTTDEGQEASEMDFNLDDADKTSVSEDSVAEASEEDVSLDLSDDIEESDNEEISLDLSEVDMNAEESDVAEEADAVAAANDDSAEEGDFDFTSRGDDDEISTKLDLARAYLDMGDHDGTRDILDEVLADGNDEQKQEANDLMKKLG